MADRERVLTELRNELARMNQAIGALRAVVSARRTERRKRDASPVATKATSKPSRAKRGS